MPLDILSSHIVGLLGPPKHADPQHRKGLDEVLPLGEQKGIKSLQNAQQQLKSTPADEHGIHRGARGMSWAMKHIQKSGKK